MAIFSIEIDGRPVMAFNAVSPEEAEAFGQDEDLREDLQILLGPDGPLWNGQSIILVRDALADEVVAWEEAVAEEREAGEIDEAEDTFAVYLVAVTDPEDEDEL